MEGPLNANVGSNTADIRKYTSTKIRTLQKIYR